MEKSICKHNNRPSLQSRKNWGEKDFPCFEFVNILPISRDESFCCLQNFANIPSIFASACTVSNTRYSLDYAIGKRFLLSRQGIPKNGKIYVTPI